MIGSRAPADNDQGDDSNGRRGTWASSSRSDPRMQDGI